MDLNSFAGFLINSDCKITSVVGIYKGTSVVAESQTMKNDFSMICFVLVIEEISQSVSINMSLFILFCFMNKVEHEFVVIWAVCVKTCGMRQEITWLSGQT